MPEQTTTVTMLSYVTSGITTVIGWIATTVNEIVGAEGALKDLAPLFAIGISISAILLGVKMVRSIVWGA